MAEEKAEEIVYREPSIEDGAEVWKMVDETAALDANSAYTYFMVFRNFAATSVVAEVDGEIAGMVTAYPLPDDPQRLFVWQVNVAEKFQGRGIARGMLEVGVRVHNARVATVGERVDDVFFVTDERNQPLSDDAVAALQRELERRIGSPGAA